MFGGSGHSVRRDGEECGARHEGAHPLKRGCSTLNGSRAAGDACSGQSRPPVMAAAVPRHNTGPPPTWPWRPAQRLVGWSRRARPAADPRAPTRNPNFKVDQRPPEYAFVRPRLKSPGRLCRPSRQVAREFHPFPLPAFCTRLTFPRLAVKNTRSETGDCSLSTPTRSSAVGFGLLYRTASRVSPQLALDSCTA